MALSGSQGGSFLGHYRPYCGTDASGMTMCLTSGCGWATKRSGSSLFGLCGGHAQSQCLATPGGRFSLQTQSSCPWSSQAPGLLGGQAEDRVSTLSTSPLVQLPGKKSCPENVLS